MKKKTLLCFTLVFLAAALYSLAVLAAAQSAPAGLWRLLPTALLTLGGLVLVGCRFRYPRFGRWNSDIFTTLYLIVTFLSVFTLPSSQLLALSLNQSALRWLLVFAPMAQKLAAEGIGLHEIALFLALLCHGMTIGEEAADRKARREKKEEEHAHHL